jgi:hypothetical protein
VDFSSDQISNAIACIALIISSILAFLYIRDRRHAKFIIANDYINQLLQWHHAVVDVLMELRLREFEKNCNKKKDLLIRLSALIEKGRFFFPNIKADEYGTDNPPAYRGYRNVGLDFLVASYNLHHNAYSEVLDRQAAHLQRLFTSVVYEIVEPSDRLEAIRILTDHYFVKGLSVEDLENPESLAAVSNMWNRPVKST